LPEGQDTLEQPPRPGPEVPVIPPAELLSSIGVLEEPTRQPRFNSILLLGPPGSGKGVLGDILRSIPGFYRFSSGEVFRRLDVTSKLGRVFLDYSARGELVPDDLVIQLWLANIYAHSILGDFKPARDLLVLDGLPRTVVQAQTLGLYLDVRKVIHLECRDREALVERLRYRALKEGRPDDADEKVIRHRLTVYEDETQPVLAFYPSEKVAAIDCLGTPLQVAAQVLPVLVPATRSGG
jgi:adenylate kinase